MMPGGRAGPKVSIITPAYNAQTYLHDTIVSALRQTVTDFELLIVDDGSTDNTAAIADDFAAVDSRVRLLRQRNGGSATARNTAMAEARGEYFALLDSDDLWMPSFLSSQLAILDAHPEVDIVSSNAMNLGGVCNQRPLKPASRGWAPLSLRQIIEEDDSVCIMSVFRRRVIDRIGGFDPAILGNEDYDFWIRAAHAGYQIVFNSWPCAYYRRRPDSKSADEYRALAGIIEVLRKTRPLFDDGDEHVTAIDRQVEKFVRRQLIVAAKSALTRREFETSRRVFCQLAENDVHDAYLLVARLGRRMPHL